ncbi:MAG: hypothetical protein K2Q10_08525, partial [Rhodospirillales bacterium]|nr:hypothetical protein [Rhodospirillales bacterium]
EFISRDGCSAISDLYIRPPICTFAEAAAGTETADDDTFAGPAMTQRPFPSDYKSTRLWKCVNICSFFYASPSISPFQHRW